MTIEPSAPAEAQIGKPKVVPKPWGEELCFARTERYAGKLSDHAVADRLAAACGHLGSGAEYLLNTVAALERIGVHDGRLWRLQEMVAERIAANCEA